MASRGDEGCLTDMQGEPLLDMSRWSDETISLFLLPSTMNEVERREMAHSIAHALSGDQCGEQRGHDLEHSTGFCLFCKQAHDASVKKSKKKEMDHWHLRDVWAWLHNFLASTPLGHVLQTSLCFFAQATVDRTTVGGMSQFCIARIVVDARVDVTLNSF